MAEEKSEPAKTAFSKEGRILLVVLVITSAVFALVVDYLNKVDHDLATLIGEEDGKNHATDLHHYDRIKALEDRLAAIEAKMAASESPKPAETPAKK